MAHTEETKRKISESEKGKILSEETKIKIGKAAKGRIWSEESRKKLSDSKKGEKAYQWKGGISRKYKTGYYSLEYINWRKAIFMRDNYTCQERGKAEYITAHHIKSFAKFPQLRFIISNGITLCENCHSKTDNYKVRAKKK